MSLVCCMRCLQEYHPSGQEDFSHNVSNSATILISLWQVIFPCQF